MYQLIFAAEPMGHEILCAAICLIYLIILAVQDLKSRTVSTWLLICGILAAILYQLMWSEESFFLCIAGAVIGVGFIGISMATKEGIGYGDSILILALGIYMGLWNLLYLLILAFTFSTIFSMIVLIKSQYHKMKTFPFVPFITFGYLILFLEKLY